jgi:hypothetical protein
MLISLSLQMSLFKNILCLSYLPKAGALRMHALGQTVRLENGTVARVVAGEVLTDISGPNRPRDVVRVPMGKQKRKSMLRSISNTVSNVTRLGSRSIEMQQRVRCAEPSLYPLYLIHETPKLHMHMYIIRMR